MAVLGAVCALLDFSCAPPGPSSPAAVARLGGREIRWSDFEAYLGENAPDATAAAAPELLSHLLDRFLEEESLRRLAVDRGLAGAVASRREAVAGLLAAGPGAIEEGAVASYYAAHPAEFELPERVELAQLLLEDRQAARAARAAAASGTDFAEVQRRFASTSSPAGEPRAELAREDLPPALAQVVFSLHEGEVSEVVAAEYGYHLFKVVRRLPAGRQSLASAAPAIRERLRREQADAQLDLLAAEARSRYDPLVYVGNLPFAYAGTCRRAP